MTDSGRSVLGLAMVPYVTSWSGERVAVPGELMVRRRGGGIRYRAEVRADRGVRGVLFKREKSAPGQGQPMFRLMHGARQRQAMRQLLCQVCGGPADRNKQGVLWLMPDHREDWPGWPQGMRETAPPVCLRCAGVSRRLCPALRRSVAAVRVKNPVVTGVRGVVYRPQPSGRQVEAIGHGNIDFKDPHLLWTLASQLVCKLGGCTLIDLDQELANSNGTVS